MNALITISTILTMTIGILGLLYAFLCIVDAIIEKATIGFRVKRVICEYIFHRDEIKIWLRRNCAVTDLTPATPRADTANAIDGARKE